MAVDETNDGPCGVEFFGVKLKVNNPRLAALLNSNVNDDVQVIGRRAREAFAGDSRAAYEDVHRRELSADGSTVRVISDDESPDG
ncbi:MAG: hypothetical protein NTX16_04865 [Actinobacteria bacterium]|nr:hypothetical protein [Actinomycetota bacterium]